MTVLGFVGGAGLVAFRFSNLSADKARVAALRQDSQDEAVVQAELAKSQQDLDEAKATLTHLEMGIPSTAYIPTMLQELEKIGKDCGISVTGVRPVPKAVTAAVTAQSADGSASIQKPAYDQLDIEVKGRGNYSSVQKFVKALQTFPKIVGAHTIDIVPCLEPKEAASGVVDITLGLRAYLFKDAGDKKPADTAAAATDKTNASPNAGEPAKDQPAKTGAPQKAIASAPSKEASA